MSEVQITGRAGVPAGASAAMLNVSAVGPSRNGFLTVFDCTPKIPNASNVNFVAGQTVPNAVLAKLTSSGEVCVYSFAETDLVIDVNAYG